MAELALVAVSMLLLYWLVKYQQLVDEYGKIHHLVEWLQNENRKMSQFLEHGSDEAITESLSGCDCHACLSRQGERAWWMVVCSLCGNKRCPRTEDCRFKCTNSNQPGQVGELENVLMKGDVSDGQD